ncbi:MAG: hypothetical protein AB7S38_36585 [Vulcanimicrobiota bacterium]
MKTSTKKRRGVALVVILMSLALLAAVAMGLATISSGQLMHAHSESQSLEALYAARAGAWIKLGQVRAGDTSAIGPIALATTGATYSATVTVGPGPGTPPFPPADTYYVEATGTSKGGHQRKMAILASLSQTRWSHAAFGNTQVRMQSGSYTDSFDSSGATVDHSKATVASNAKINGIYIEDPEKVVVGWANSTDISTGKKKKGKKDDDVELNPEARAMGPPASVESQVITGSAKAHEAYKGFATTSQKMNVDPVTMPLLPAGASGAVVDPLVSTNPSVSGAALSQILPGAYHDLAATTGETAVLDVSALPPGSTAQYVFHHIDLNQATLQIKQPAAPAAPVTVQIYVDTGKGASADPTAGIRMTGASLVNDKQVPALLQILIAGTGKNILEGHDELKDGVGPPTAYYVVYAPEGLVDVTRGQIYGAVVADVVKLDGESLTDPDKAPAVIHFDTALLNDTSNPAMFNVLSIQNL